MHPFEAIFLVAYLAVSPFVFTIFKENKLWTLAWMSGLPYFAILLVGTYFPYIYPYPRNPYLTGLILGTVFSLVGALYFGFSRFFKNIERLPHRGQRAAGLESLSADVTTLVLMLSWLSVVLHAVEFLINPEMRFSSHLLENRNIYGQSTMIGTLGKFLSGFALISWQIVVTQYAIRSESVGVFHSIWVFLRSGRGFKYFGLRILPFFILVAVYLASGNRQFVFFGVVVMFLTLMYCRGLKFFFKPAAILALALLVLGSVSFQFYRNRDSEGQQDVFLRAVIGLEAKEWNPFIEDYNLDSSLMLIFTYYGIQYNVFSALVEGNVYHDTLFVGTAPLVYRRIQGPLKLRDQSEIGSAGAEALKSQLSSYGGVWVTVFGNFFSEFGWISLIGYIVLLQCGIYIIGKNSKSYSAPIVLLTGIAGYILFGIHYSLSADNFGLCYLIVLLWPGQLWIKQCDEKKANRLRFK